MLFLSYPRRPWPGALRQDVLSGFPPDERFRSHIMVAEVFRNRESPSSSFCLHKERDIDRRLVALW